MDARREQEPVPTAAPPTSWASGRPRRVRKASIGRPVLLAGLIAAVASALVGSPGAAALGAQGVPTATGATAPAPGASTPLPPVTVTGPVDPAPSPPFPSTPDPSAHLRVLLTRLVVIDARDRLTARRAAATRGQADQAAAEADVDGAVRARGDAEQRLRQARRRLDSSAVYAYMHAPGSDLPAALRGDSTAGGRERELLSTSIDEHGLQVGQARDLVVRAQARVDSARVALDRVRQEAAEQDGRVVSAARDLADAREHLRAAVADERALVPATAWELPIEGPSAFTARELVRWYEQQGHGSYATVPMEQLAGAFVELGNDEGVRGDMAFAQAIHETGWFTNTDTVVANNFAGIGHCSACAGGIHFASAETGVLAQIQLLKSYAEADPVYNNPRAAPGLDGPNGCCPTWNRLGGVWASDPGYGPRILARYTEMVEWLVVQRRLGL